MKRNWLILAVALLGVVSVMAQQKPNEITFLGHHLGETVDEYLKTVGEHDEAGGGPCTNSDDETTPVGCIGEEEPGVAVYPFHYAGQDAQFHFLNSQLVKIRLISCGEGADQVSLLSKKFGGPTRSSKTAMQNGFSERWVNTTWIWDISPTIHLKVFENRNPANGLCHSSPTVSTWFERPEKPPKAAVNPY